MNFKTRTRAYGARSSSITVASFSHCRPEVCLIDCGSYGKEIDERICYTLVYGTPNVLLPRRPIMPLLQSQWIIIPMLDKKHRGSSGLNDPMTFKIYVGSKTHSTVMPSDWSMIVKSSIKYVTSAPFQSTFGIQKTFNNFDLISECVEATFKTSGLIGVAPDQKKIFSLQLTRHPQGNIFLIGTFKPSGSKSERRPCHRITVARRSSSSWHLITEIDLSLSPREWPNISRFSLWTLVM